MSDELENLRRRLERDLPASIHAALTAYARFTADEPPADAKGFAAWHAAAKAALGHVDASVKLLRWAGGEAETAALPDDGLVALLSQARDAIEQLEETEEP